MSQDIFLHLLFENFYLSGSSVMYLEMTLGIPLNKIYVLPSLWPNQANEMEKGRIVLMLSILWPNKCCIGNNQPIQWSLFCLAIDSIFSSFPMMHGTVVILRDNWTPNLYWISSITILLMEHEETGWLALKQSFSLNLMINVSFTHSKNMSQVPTMC